MSFKEISIKDVETSPAELFGDRWALIGSGDIDNHNIMTASWGMLGKLWNKDVAFIFIRPQRYTYEIIEKEDYFTVNFLSGKYKDALNICGAASGRDCDKFERANLSPYYVEGTTAVEQANLVVVCKKIAITDMKPEDFISDEIDGFYKDKDYHRVYVGEIIKVLEK